MATKRSASSAVCAATKVRATIPLNTPLKRRYRATDLDESRALANIMGIPWRRLWRNKFGHSSVSITMPIRGRARARKRRTEPGVS